jgi:hypothetical protein
MLLHNAQGSYIFFSYSFIMGNKRKSSPFPDIDDEYDDEEDGEDSEEPE